MSKFHIGRAFVLFFIIWPFIILAGQSSGVSGWVVSGSSAQKYYATVDNAVVRSGIGSAVLTAATDVAGSEYGTLMQFVDARPHHGKRMKFSAFVKTAGVTTGAALWMRIDSVDGEVLAFDNMSSRGWVRGNQPWSQIDVVLDVPAESKLVSFGVLLKGEGMVWIDDASMEPVSTHIATTGSSGALPPVSVAPDELPLLPANLDFEY